MSFEIYNCICLPIIWPSIPQSGSDSVIWKILAAPVFLGKLLFIWNFSKMSRNRTKNDPLNPLLQNSSFDFPDFFLHGLRAPRVKVFGFQGKLFLAALFLLKSLCQFFWFFALRKRFMNTQKCHVIFLAENSHLAETGASMAHIFFSQNHRIWFFENFVWN